MANEKVLKVCEVLGHDFKFRKCQVNTLAKFYNQKEQLSPNLKDEHTLRIEYICYRCIKRDIVYLDISKFIYHLAVDTYAKPQGRWAESFNFAEYLKNNEKKEEKNNE